MKAVDEWADGMTAESSTHYSSVLRELRRRRSSRRSVDMGEDQGHGGFKARAIAAMAGGRSNAHNNASGEQSSEEEMWMWNFGSSRLVL